MVLVTAVAMSSRPMPRAASESGLTMMVGAYFCAPKISTCPTPGSVEMRCATSRSANWSSCVNGIACDVTPRISTGVSAGLTFL